MRQNNEMLMQIMMLDFAVQDAALFLDTHQKDQEAYRYLKEANQRLNALKAQYTKQYGPLTNRSDEPNSYTYAKGPWPWEGVR